MFNTIFKRQQGKSTHVHSALAIPVLLLLALAVGIYAATVPTEQDIFTSALSAGLFTRVRAAEPPKQIANFTSIDVMKLTKDTVANQPTPADIASIVDALSQLNPKYIAVSVPMDSSADFNAAGYHPSPQSVEDFTKSWADAIHARGMHVLWRGTWSGLEGLYNFPQRVGSNRLTAGDVATAPVDGGATWLGKTYAYITEHPDYFQNGDIWAPMPERTQGIFQDSTSFLPYSGGIQNNYTAFFVNLKAVSATAFLNIGKPGVYTGWTANNFSEAANGWLNPSIYGAADDLVAVDYYGTTHTPDEMFNSIMALHKKTGRQIFLEEWSDYWDTGLSEQGRQSYESSMYAVFQSLASGGVLAGFNYWGGWQNSAEGILVKTATGYQLNSRGVVLKNFFAQLPRPQVQLARR